MTGQQLKSLMKHLYNGLENPTGIPGLLCPRLRHEGIKCRIGFYFIVRPVSFFALFTTEIICSCNPGVESDIYFMEKGKCLYIPDPNLHFYNASTMLLIHIHTKRVYLIYPSLSLCLFYYVYSSRIVKGSHGSRLYLIIFSLSQGRPAWEAAGV